MIEDSAVWEREPKTLPLSIPKRQAAGYADIFTWQSRMICLEVLPLGGVKVVRFVAGEGFENPLRNPDPMQPYKTDKTHGKLPVRFDPNRNTWRDFDSLLPDDSDLAPLTIQHAIRLAGSTVGRMPKSVLVLGLKYQPPSANVDFWRMERFALPEALSGDRFIRTEIRQLLKDAEDAQNSLQSTCRIFARNMLSRGVRKPPGKDISGFIEHMPLTSRYWSTLESRFHEILSNYTLERDSDNIRCQWLKSIRHALMTAWKQYRASVSMSDAWAIRALVKAERPIQDKLKELTVEIKKLEPRKEDA